MAGEREQPDDSATLPGDGGPRIELREAKPGDVLAERYELLAEMGRGAYGVVYRAHDRVAGTDIAIKVLAQSRRLSPVAAERLRRELRAAWTVTHPGVVRVHDLILSGDQLALSMELVDGETLDQRIKRTGALALPELTTLASDLANALAAAHGAGVTHRDLKPSNIMLRASGGAVITDFGLSRMAGFGETPAAPSTETSDASDLTRTGELLGTPAFMAPEQLRGAADVGPAADVYAFGLVLFEAATGVRVHPQTTLTELVAARFDKPAASVASLRPELAAPLARVIDDCLLVDLARRIPDAIELRRRLALDARPPRRRRVLVATASLVVLAGAGVWWMKSRGSAPSELPAHDRRIVFQVEGERDLDRALRQLAGRRFRARDQHVEVVDDPRSANVTVHLSWRPSGDGVELTSLIGTLGRPARPLPPRRAGSLAEAFDLVSEDLATIVDAGQPVRPPDERLAIEMAEVGAHDVEAYKQYQVVVDQEWSTTVIDVSKTAPLVEAVIARDPTWLHPYSLLVDVYGHFGERAEAARVRGLAAAPRERDPGGWLVLQPPAADIGHERERVAALDQAFAAAPDDMVVGWDLLEKLLLQHRDTEAVGVTRTLHARRPDLQFGSDLEQVLITTGHPDDAAEVQRVWMRDAPDNEQAWNSQILMDLAAGRAAEATRRAREVLVLYGRTTLRLVALVDTALAAGDLAEATTITTSMLRGTDFERSMAWFNLGKIDLIQGHFSAALEAWRSAVLKAKPLGTQGPEVQTLEELSALEQYLGDRDELAAIIDRLLELYVSFGDETRTVAHRIVRSALATPRVCPDVAALVRGFTGEAKATFERAASRAAASTGCTPCSTVVKLGGSPDERGTRTLFRFGVCAEQVGELELARDAFERARPLLTLNDNSSADPATVYAILADYHLGAVLQRLGRTAEARDAYGRFLARWGHADRPIPEVDKARAALAR